MSLDTLKSSRSVIKAGVTRFKKHVDAFNGDSDVGTFKGRLEKFEPLYDSYNHIQSQIEILINGDDIQEVTQETDREQFETSYFETLSKARNLIAACEGGSGNIRSLSRASNSPNQDQGESSRVAGVNLPKITLPTFDGAYGNWLKFRDTFKSLIHEHSSLSNIQKFHYLNSALVGDAARVIQSLGISDANYTLAWDSLKARYEDSKSLVHHHTRALFELPSVGKESYATLRQLIDDTNNHLLAPKALDEKTETWDTMIIYLLTTKLDSGTKREWGKALQNITGKPTLRDLKDFLEKHCKYLHKLSFDKVATTANKSEAKPNHTKKGNFVKSHAATKKTCPGCKESHARYSCEDFKKLPVPERLQRVRELNVCFNCFSSGHRNKDCYGSPCRKCSRKHNTMIHVESNNATSQAQAQVGNPSPPQQPESAPSGSKQASMTARATPSKAAHVLLATATVYLLDQRGNRQECRALLDSGSQPHFMTQEVCRRLGLRKTKSGITISGIEQGNHSVAHQTTVKLQSRINEFNATTTCLILDKITDDMPNIPGQSLNFAIPKGIELADPAFDRSRPIDLLIGAGLFYDLFCVGQVKLGQGQPLLQKTHLGWIIPGTTSACNYKKQGVVCNLVRGDPLNDTLEKFWRIENCFAESNQYNERDFCEQHFRQTTKHDADGRLIVSIPFKEEIKEVGHSQEMSYQRLLSTERKLAKQPELKEQYIKFMTEYEDLGHMTEILEGDRRNDGSIYYLPHHAVTKAESTTTKLRVVFDGSAKTTSGLSLNNVQYIGPTVQDDLFSIVLRFRQHRYVLSADIAKMYRQIKIQDDQRDFQRILWRTDSSLPVRHFKLNTVTYGTASAPFLATRCLRQIGIECENRYPLASNVIRKDFYVDDLLTGTDTLEAAGTLKNQLIESLGEVKFELRKWASNDSRVFANTDDTSTQPMTIQDDKDPKTLGLLWDPATDNLKYRVKPNNNRRVTKRTILAIISQIFDPLGLVGPATIRAKVILQKLWQLQLDWDESLP